MDGDSQRNTLSYNSQRARERLAGNPARLSRPRLSDDSWLDEPEEEISGRASRASAGRGRSGDETSDREHGSPSGAEAGRGTERRTQNRQGGVGEAVSAFLSVLLGFLAGAGQWLLSLVIAVGEWVTSIPERHRKNVGRKRRRHAAMKRKLSPEAYREYLKREKIRSIARAAIYAAIALVSVTVLYFAGRGLGFVFRRVFSKGEKTPVVQTELVTEAETEPAIVYPERTVTVGATGSMLLHSPFISSYPDAQGNYDFGTVYKFITPYYSEPDFMTCEFEGTLAGPEAGYSGYPNFKSPDVIIENIRDSGVDLQMIASNHVYDAGSQAFHRTMDVYAEKGILFGGARRQTSDKRYYVADLDGVQVGFIDYTYQTSGGGTNVNGIPVSGDDAQLLNSFDPDDMEAFYQEMEENVEAMRADGARFVIVNLHWGLEYHLEESEEQRTIAQRLCDMGVDAVIGGHPHCEQPIDVFTSSDGSHTMFIIFSTGNALSNQRTYLMDSMPTGHTEDGVMVTLTLHQASSGKVSITGVDILPTWVYRFQDNGSKYYIFPLDDVEHLEEKTGVTGVYEEAKASYERTMEELGPGLEKAKKAFGDSQKTSASPEKTEETGTEETETVNSDNTTPA